MIYLGCGFLSVLIWHFLSEILWRKERRELIDRLSAKNYQEFRYYNEQYRDDLKTLKKARKDEFDKMKKEESSTSRTIDEETEKYLSQLEEDWRPETLNLDEIKTISKTEE